MLGASIGVAGAGAGLVVALKSSVLVRFSNAIHVFAAAGVTGVNLIGADSTALGCAASDCFKATGIGVGTGG